LAQSPSTAWLGIAFQETVGTDLAASSDLEIIPADDVERAERELNVADGTGFTAATLKTLCGNLSCDYVVTGSYLATGDSVRLDTHLLSARDGSSLGSDTETQPLNRLLPLIAANSRALRSKFGLAADTSNDGQGEVSAAPEAFTAYSKGLEQMKLYDGPAAVKFFERSISIDPNFPLAHLAYSEALTIAGHEEQAAGQARIAHSLSGNLSRRMQLAIEARCEQTEHHFDQAATTFQTLSTFYPDAMEYVWMRAAMLQDGSHPDQAISLLLQVVNDDARPNGQGFGSEVSRDPRLYSQLSDAYALSGDWPASMRWARAGVDEARRRGAFVLYERMLTSESQAELYMNQLPQAEVATTEALRLARKFSDRSGELRALNRMGQVQMAQGRFSEARGLLKQALTIEEAGGEVQRQIHTLSALGQTLFSLGDHAGAKATFEHELKLAQNFGHPATTLGAELDMAREETLTGDRATGLEHLASIRRRAQGIGNKQLQIEADIAIRKVSS
jgi:tetratricopeptide (TPR) repeat protein